MARDKARSAELWKAWYATHRQEVLARRKETRDPAQAAEQWQRWYGEHREELAAKKRARYAARREECLAKQRADYWSRAEEKRAYQREYIRRHPPTPQQRFARGANQHVRRFGSTERLDWHNLTLGPCTYCGTDTKVTWDHVIPLSQGGANTAANCVRSCLPCNRRKQAMTPEEWRDTARIEAQKARKRAYIRQWHRDHRTELREKWRAKHPKAQPRV